MITNFTAANPDIGYMETIMDWDLIVRESADMIALSEWVPQHQIAQLTVYRGCNDCIWYLEMIKRA